jgi:hypothetical protein
MNIVPSHNIEILIRSLVYVPIWAINMKIGDFIYKRKALAASSTIVMDEIALCSKYSSFTRIWNKSKQTIALCETCGNQINQSFYCEKHLPDT